MRALVASLSTDRISHSAIVVAGTLCGVLVFFVAVPLAISSPFPAPREGSWVIDRPSVHIATPLTLPPDIDERDAARESELVIPWSFVSLPESGVASRFEPAEFGDPEPTGSIASTAISEAAPRPATEVPPAPERAAAIMDEVDDYL